MKYPGGGNIVKRFSAHDGAGVKVVVNRMVVVGCVTDGRDVCDGSIEVLLDSCFCLFTGRVSSGRAAINRGPAWVYMVTCIR